MHVAPAYAGSNHSYVCSLILHFYQRLFSELEVLNHDLIAIIWQILRQEFIALQTKIPSSPGTVTLVCTMIALKAGWAASLPRLVIQAAMATWALCFMDYSSLKCTTFMPLDMSDDFKSTTEEKNMTRNKISQLDILTNRQHDHMGITSNQSKSICWELLMVAEELKLFLWSFPK
jgi:hypothetical protein